ncbi:site-specific integrase [Aedoeadaptatus coxii]|uniref:tyrosine-type recombinase/integrase n=1 Tax=Aedoeadaptatus coxii TaxID=755172 RepID=UPI002AD289C1|nr:site-specific integrase [Peptoniphilus coxii]
MKQCKFISDELQTRFLLCKKLNGVQEITLASYRKVFMNFEHQTGKPIDYDNLMEQVADFFFAINWYSDMTFNNQRSNLNGYFNFLVEVGVIKENPIKALAITRRKEEDKPRPANKDDLIKLLSVIPIYSYVGLRDYTMILLMADTGIRPAEIVRLKVDHLNLARSSIILTKDITKTKRERITPISDGVKSSLIKFNKIIESVFEDRKYLFLTEQGEKMNTYVLRNNMKAYSEKAGVKITPYQLRHFFGTEYLRHDGNLLYLQKVLGHSNLNTTRKYIQISDDDLLRSHQMVSPAKGLMNIRQL